MRVPKITPKAKKSGSILIRFQLTQEGVKKDYQLTLPLKWVSRRDRRVAEQVADLIKDDIKHDALGLQPPSFDPTLQKYKPGLSVGEKKTQNLLDVWDEFVKFKVKEGKIQETTLTKHYSDSEKVLQKVRKHNPELLKPDKSTEFLDYLSDRYKPSTLVPYYGNWSACANWAVKRNIWDKNPYSLGLSELKSQRQATKSGKSYPDSEASVILDAFATDRFTSKFATIKHSYYYEFLKFLFLTGVRPQLAIALDWEQIIWEGDRPDRIYFDRAYTERILKPSKGNRNGKNFPLVFPVNDELAELIKSIPKRETIQRKPTISKHLKIKRSYCPNLVFPSFRHWYLDIGKFTTRTFKPVVEALVHSGEVLEYLSTYHSRHTMQNRCLEAGMSEEEIAALLDTSPEIIRKHYRDNRRYRESLAQRVTLPSLNQGQD